MQNLYPKKENFEDKLDMSNASDAKSHLASHYTLWAFLSVIHPCHSIENIYNPTSSQYYTSPLNLESMSIKDIFGMVKDSDSGSHLASYYTLWAFLSIIYRSFHRKQL